MKRVIVDFAFFRQLEPGDVQVEGGRGIANVIATFSEPGEYMIHTKVENFRAPDSSERRPVLLDEYCSKSHCNSVSY